MEEENTDILPDEEVILSRWEKTKQYIEMGKTSFTVGKIIWGLFFVSGTTAMVGVVTDTNPLRNAAVEVGLVEEEQQPYKELYANIETLEDLLNKHEEMHASSLQHEHDFKHEHDLTHEHALEAHEHAMIEHTHPISSAQIILDTKVSKAIVEEVALQIQKYDTTHIDDLH